MPSADSAGNGSASPLQCVPCVHWNAVTKTVPLTFRLIQNNLSFFPPLFFVFHLSWKLFLTTFSCPDYADFSGVTLVGETECDRSFFPSILLHLPREIQHNIKTLHVDHPFCSNAARKKKNNKPNHKVSVLCLFKFGIWVSGFAHVPVPKAVQELYSCILKGCCCLNGNAKFYILSW